ncbi:MAG TPA: tetratricopeptide repeat protein [Verrucomicrobiae bacterium]|jgi:tetratricopeptide (TPR) repeat protein|nr:tetratricopeptide repeat protein [Verrucomicrobiae bacterium]
MADSNTTDASDASRSWLRRYMFCVVCVAVIGMLIMGAEPGVSVLKNTEAKDCYYNLLVQGFRAGQLNLKKDVPPGLTRLANPYDPAANAPYIPDVGDMSYYKGKLYLYYGVAPALVLYWPYVAVTDHYLQDSWAGLFFCSIGFLIGALLLYAIWRRYFPKVNMWAALAGIFIFGLMIATHESEWVGIRIYEVALSSGFAFAMLALAAIWGALHQPGRRTLWLLLASLAYGMAVASRPPLLFGAVILLIPVIQVWRGGVAGATPYHRMSAIGGLLAAAAGPILAIGVGQMIYNAMRFGNPLEFGCRYEVTGTAPETDLGQFSLHYLWFNVRYYFWEPANWSLHLPFIRPAPHWSTSTGHFGPERYYGGLLILFPVVWFALAAPLAWRDRSSSLLRWFLLIIFSLFAAGAAPICLFNVTCERYELDFLPALMLAAIIGIFAIENNAIGSRLWRGVVRFGWCALAVCMAITSFSGGLDSYAAANYFAGNVLVNRGSPDIAIERFRRVLAIEPDFAGAYTGQGNALLEEGRTEDAIAEYEKALTLNPNLSDTRYGLASCFMREGRFADALVYFQKAVEIAPNSADARNNYGYCLMQIGRAPEAIVQFQKAVEAEPDSANLRCGLGNALLKVGRRDEAIAQYQKAVELEPNVAGLHFQLATSLAQNGRLDDAIGQFQKAVELGPDSATFHMGYAKALGQKGITNQAAAEFKKAVELEPELSVKPSDHTKQEQVKRDLPVAN